MRFHIRTFGVIHKLLFVFVIHPHKAAVFVKLDTPGYNRPHFLRKCHLKSGIRTIRHNHVLVSAALDWLDRLAVYAWNVVFKTCSLRTLSSSCFLTASTHWARAQTAFRSDCSAPRSPTTRAPPFALRTAPFLNKRVSCRSPETVTWQ